MEEILIVEYSKNIQQLINSILMIGKYNTKVASDGKEALELISKNHFGLILLDIMLPKVDGFEVMEAIQKKNIPVIFLTARSDIESIVKGFKYGAQDYIKKPFEPLELLARVEAVLNRNEKKHVTSTYIYKDIKVNVVERKVLKGEKEIFLTPKEFDLLTLFLENIGVALSRNDILNLVWGYEVLDIETRTVDYHIQQLRKKLDLKANIKSINKIGYRLEATNEI